MRRMAYLLLLSLPLAAIADERILDFHSEIVVMQDGWIEVTERITVRAEGNRIRRGIYRDFPTEYYDKHGNRYEVALEPLAVLRNDLPEAFHTQSVRRGVRTYFGHRNQFISPGVHTYTFRYRASRMLGFFPDHDEIYWNVTGFDWYFPIDKARATVSFDFEVAPGAIASEAYTGPMGSREQDYTSRIDADSRVYFEANAPLSTVNGLTIVVSWPKGLVDEPTGMQRVGWLLNDNANLLVAFVGFILILVYYIPVWRRYGKDPEEGVIVTRYEPPDGYSPASLRYIRQMYYDGKVMTAAVVNLAVKGYLCINKHGSEHSLTKTDPGANPPRFASGEKDLYEALFRDGNTVILDDEYHELLGNARSEHVKSLKKNYAYRYFRTNGALNVPPIIVVVASTLLAFNVGAGAQPLTIAMVIVMYVTMATFAIIMKRPTIRGRKLLDEMLGFKDYLEIAEKDELNLRNPPEKTPQLFESYLPYALALGVDQQWAERFAAILASIRDADGRPYKPAWYSGSWSTSNLTSNTSKLSGGLNTAISSSVTPPGSSSGSGGGGSSGGGGGGGGGGGW